MTYFAKYLPVEGEIKVGEIGLFLGQVEEITGLMKHSAESNDKLIQKVKLFLCSRDIQVGDKVRTTKDNINFFNDIVTEKRDNGYFTDEEDPTGSSGLFYYPHQIFKVTGEISPEAVWVKEGDEFDEYQFDYKDATYTNRICKLKCSQCNTFH